MLRAACVVVATAVTAAAAPLPDLDPLLPGTKWVGTVTQAGQHRGQPAVPREYAGELLVTARDGSRFEAEFFQYTTAVPRNDRVTYLVAGTIGERTAGKGFAVRFRTTGVKSSDINNAVAEVRYEGELLAKTLKGSWSAPPDEPGTLYVGGFTLVLKR